MKNKELDFRIKIMQCNGKDVPDEYMACFNDYIKKVINKKFKELDNELKSKQNFLKCSIKDNNDILFHSNELIDQSNRVINCLIGNVKGKDAKISGLLQELDLYKKALELACERIGKEHCIFDPKCVQNFEKNIYINKFLQQAKESLKCKE